VRVVYPVYMVHCEDGGYFVDVPDLGVATQGEDLADAIKMARDVIGVTLTDYIEKNEPFPTMGNKMTEYDDYCIETLVDVDAYEYANKYSKRKVKKNCTIPYYLNEEAERQGINFSQVLSEALAEKLGIA